ncbi:MAG: hypothetical protein ACI92O_000349 [Colwellia sp.]|jgi:hypothetical protein
MILRVVKVVFILIMISISGYSKADNIYTYVGDKFTSTNGSATTDDSVKIMIRSRDELKGLVDLNFDDPFDEIEMYIYIQGRSYNVAELIKAQKSSSVNQLNHVTLAIKDEEVIGWVIFISVPGKDGKGIQLHAMKDDNDKYFESITLGFNTETMKSDYHAWVLTKGDWSIVKN